MSRSTAEIIVDLINFNPNSNNKLGHDCYMVLVGFLQSKTHLQTLKDMINAQGDQYGEEDIHAAGSIKIMECEEVETILEYITLKYNTDELNDARQERFVYEDNFNPTLCEYMENNASYDKLKRICRRYEEFSKTNPDIVIREHTDRANKSYR